MDSLILSLLDQCNPQFLVPAISMASRCFVHRSPSDRLSFLALLFLIGSSLYTRTDAGYIFVNTTLNWHDAEAYCQSTYGTHLASWSTDAEATQMQAMLPRGAWVGLNDLTANHVWTFVGNEFDCMTFDALYGCRSFDYWRSGEPSDDTGTNADCAYAIAGNSIRDMLNDAPCVTAIRFVCNSAPTEAPTTPSTPPTPAPSASPTTPTNEPTASPSQPSQSPSSSPSNSPTTPTSNPSTSPSDQPTTDPTADHGVTDNAARLKTFVFLLGALLIMVMNAQ